MKHVAIAAALILGCQAADAQQSVPWGSPEDVSYAGALWEAMTGARLAGEGAMRSFPYEGVEPHGLMLETFYTDATVDGHTGMLVVKRNYGPEGVTVDQVLGQPGDHLWSVTVMFMREEGYAPETGNWFWAKYLPDGSLDANANGVPSAGLVGKGANEGCLTCHSGASGEDFLFTTSADFTGSGQ